MLDSSHETADYVDYSGYIEEFYEGGPDDMEEFRLYCETGHIPLIKRETENFLKTLLTLTEPSRILEIGTGAGYSATVFAKCLKTCHITTLEMIDKRIDDARGNFLKYGVNERINLIPGNATESLSELVKEGSATFDFVFIDCAKSRYRDFFEKALKITGPEGLIVCDNVLLSGRTVSDEFFTKHRDKTSALKMREFVRYLKGSNAGESEFETSLFNIGDGLTLSVKAGTQSKDIKSNQRKTK